MRRMKIAIGMPGTGIIDCHIGRGNQAGMQDGSVLGMKSIQPLRQKPDDLTFGNLDTDIAEQGRQSLRRNLPMTVKHQAEVPQIGAIAAPDTCWQRRNDRASTRRLPAFAAIADHFSPQDKIPYHAILVAFKARSRWNAGEQHLFTRHATRITLWSAPPRGLLLATSRLVAGRLFHARWLERRAGRQVLQPRNLVAQELVVDFQPRVFDLELVALVAKFLVFGLEVFDPDISLVSPRYQARHKLPQRLQRQRVGMLDHGKAALRHKGSES